MTEFEIEEIKANVLNAEDRTEIILTEENDVFGVRPLIVEVASEVIGHKVIIIYSYADAYNSNGVLGGRALQSTNYEII